MVSTTVTMDVQLLELPPPSVTVNVTVFGPKSSQLKLLMSRLMEAIEILSVDPLSISEAKIVAFHWRLKPRLSFDKWPWEVCYLFQNTICDKVNSIFQVLVANAGIIIIDKPWRGQTRKSHQAGSH